MATIRKKGDYQWDVQIRRKGYRDRRLKQFATRGTPGGRGQYKAVEHKPKLRKDGQPRKNAAGPKADTKEKSWLRPERSSAN